MTTVKLYTIKFFLDSTGESFSTSWIQEEVQPMEERISSMMEEIFDRETFDEELAGEGTLQDTIREVCDAIRNLSPCEIYQHHDLQVTVEWRNVQLK